MNGVRHSSQTRGDGEGDLDNVMSATAATGGGSVSIDKWTRIILGLLQFS